MFKLLLALLIIVLVFDVVNADQPAAASAPLCDAIERGGNWHGEARDPCQFEQR